MNINCQIIEYAMLNIAIVIFIISVIISYFCENEIIAHIVDIAEIFSILLLVYQIWQHRQDYIRSTFYKSLDILQGVKQSIKIYAPQLHNTGKYVSTVIGNKFFEYAYDEIEYIKECLSCKEYVGYIEDSHIEGVLYKIQECFDKCSTDGEDKESAIDFQNEQYNLLHQRFINRKYDITRERWSNQQILEQEACRIFCDKYQDVISHYIVNIETILEFIDNSYCRKCAIRDQFARILQSTLSSHEKRFLRLYIITYGDKNISKLCEEYKLLN